MKWYIVIPQTKSNFLKVYVLHTFVKYFSGTRMYEIANIFFHLQFATYGSVKTKCLQSVCSTIKRMMLEMGDNNILILWHLQRIWYLWTHFKIIISILFHLYHSRNTCFMLKCGLWNLQLESRSTNHKSFNRPC